MVFDNSVHFHIFFGKYFYQILHRYLLQKVTNLNRVSLNTLHNEVKIYKVMT